MGGKGEKAYDLFFFSLQKRHTSKFFEFKKKAYELVSDFRKWYLFAIFQVLVWSLLGTCLLFARFVLSVWYFLGNCLLCNWS